MNWNLRFDFGRDMVLINASLAPFGIVANFSRQKFGSILPLVCHSTQNTIQAFAMRIWQTKVPHFHSENPAEFCVWYAMTHR